MARAAISNPTVGRSLRMAPTSVSRLRSGSRRPSVDVMERVQREYGWEIGAQVEARRMGRYHIDLETLLIDKFGEADVSTPA